MKDKNITKKSMREEVWGIVYTLSLGIPLHVIVNNYPIKLKEFNNHLAIRLGYYKINGNPDEEELEKLCEQCQLILTAKGKEIGEEHPKRYN